MPWGGGGGQNTGKTQVMMLQTGFPVNTGLGHRLSLTKRS